jgi:hypothetical protein
MRRWVPLVPPPVKTHVFFSRPTSCQGTSSLQRTAFTTFCMLLRRRSREVTLTKQHIKSHPHRRKEKNNPTKHAIKVVHSLTTMMNMTLTTTTTAFKRKSLPATVALEEALHVDELPPMQGKRRRSMEGNNSNPYGMPDLWRETEKLERTFAFPTIEWSFDDDISVASERRGSTFNDVECIQSRKTLKTCLAPAALQATSCLLSKKSNKSYSLQWMAELSSKEERTRSFLLSLGSTEQLKHPSRTAEL